MGFQPSLRNTIVLADFTNTTGDPVFDGTLRQGLSVQLEQSPFLSIISDEQVQQTLQMMNQRPDAKLTSDLAREVCQRTSSAAVLDGSIAQIGTQYLLTVKAVKLRNRQIVSKHGSTGERFLLSAIHSPRPQLRLGVSQSCNMLLRTKARLLSPISMQAVLSSFAQR